MRLTPRGGADRIDGVGPDGELRVRVRAAPADGAANEALLRLLADELGIRRRDAILERGAAGRLKRIRVGGVSVTALGARWPGVRTE